MGIILRTELLSKSFGGLKAIDRVDLFVEEGELRSVIGSNGAGKTTLFNLITGYYPSDSGKIIWRDREITHLPVPEVTCLGIARVFQRTNTFLNLTVWENVMLPFLRVRKQAWNLLTPVSRLNKRDVEELVEEVGLSEQIAHIASTLSHGHQRRLELAIALANMPTLLLLDEPTAGMSISECTEMMNLLMRLNQKRGLTILLTEHDMKVVFSVSQRITVLHFGKIIAEGSPEEIRNNEEVQRVYLGESE
jgi:branched-chain amino acid transport system ATP-binding protein